MAEALPGTGVLAEKYDVIEGPARGQIANENRTTCDLTDKMP